MILYPASNKSGWKKKDKRKKDRKKKKDVKVDSFRNDIGTQTTRNKEMRNRNCCCTAMHINLNSERGDDGRTDGLDDRIFRLVATSWQ